MINKDVVGAAMLMLEDVCHDRSDNADLALSTVIFTLARQLERHHVSSIAGQLASMAMKDWKRAVEEAAPRTISPRP